jgi:hypothetical protein
MLISKGKVSAAEPWKILEVSIGQSPDVLALRLHKVIKTLHEKGIQALIPMKRNADGDPEWIVEHVYVRGANGSLGKLAHTPGIDFIRQENASKDWIQSLLENEEHANLSACTLRHGSFVRVLTGPCARLCGTIAAMRAGTYTVGIAMRTKIVKVYTLPENLQIVECSPEQQCFYFQNDLFAS